MRLAIALLSIMVVCSSPGSAMASVVSRSQAMRFFESVQTRPWDVEFLTKKGEELQDLLRRDQNNPFLIISAAETAQLLAPHFPNNDPYDVLAQSANLASKAYQLAPNDPTVAAYHAWVQFRNGANWEKVDMLLQRAKKLRPVSARVYLYEGLICANIRNMKCLGEAITHAGPLTNTEMQNATLFTLKRIRAMASGDGAEAERLFLKQLSTDPDNPFLLDGYAQFLAKRGRHKEAYDAYSHSLRTYFHPLAERGKYAEFEAMSHAGEQ
jgi:tetratricopeptide (TPR) repeat protein